MKTFALKLLCILSFGLLSSCEEPVPDAIAGISPVSAPDELSAFFESYLPAVSHSRNTSFLFVDSQECHVINNMKEFEAITNVSTVLPEIDFEKYTLIIGHIEKGYASYTFEKQEIYIDPDKVTLVVTLRKFSGNGEPYIYHPEDTYYDFWGLYEKISGNVSMTIREI